MTRRCICEICSCGRHRCPHPPTALYGTKGNKPCVITEYTDKYPSYGNQHPPQSLKPKQEFMGNKGRMDGTTTFKTDFIPYEITPRAGKQKAEYKPMPGEIDLATTYDQEFPYYEVKAAAPRRPKAKPHVGSGKLDTVPTYKEDFRAWALQKTEMKKPDLAYHPPPEKFGNSTTFQDDFAPRGLVARESFKPLHQPLMSDTPFDGMTSNMQSYVPHPLEARFSRPPQVYKPSGVPMQGLTSHKQDFQGLPGRIPKSCKPEHAKTASDSPFQSSTEFRERFQQWPVTAPPRQKAQEYVAPTAEMDLSTTNNTHYTRHSVQPSVSAKPFTRPVQCNTPFQSSTTTRDDFKAWASCKQEIIKKADELHRETGKIEDLTTFRSHFTQHALQPSVSFKPPNAPMTSDVPMHKQTMYTAEFTPKKISVCPASLGSPPGYAFEESDERGHRFYRRLSSKERDGRVKISDTVVVN
ncbi:stabilizer of axonemal microtubules 2 [Engraulis encrasicolus]|uniref:stabilizer of axonemal microtubules 2 n=1 Tax=Engraulis encrasicolus TaxID=184585 RepID=UPI002FD3F8D1